MLPRSPKRRPRRTSSLTSLTNLASNPPPITLWPTIFPPSGTLTPLLTSTNPKHKIQALSTVIALLTSSKKFIIAASNTPSSTTAFITPSTIALSTVRALSDLLPALLNEIHPIALAKTARLAAELSSCGITTPDIARKLYEIVLDHDVDRTSRAAAASALVSSVCKGDTDLICNTFSESLSDELAPVAEMLAVLRAAVMQTPSRFLRIWQNASHVLIDVLSHPAVGLHAVRLVQGFISASLENENESTQSPDCQHTTYTEKGMSDNETLEQLLSEIYQSILVPAAISEDQPMQLSAISAVDAFQQLQIATRHSFANILANVRAVLRRLSKEATIPVRSAALKALGNHSVHFEEIFKFLVTTSSTVTLPRAKAFSAAAVLLEKMIITEHVSELVDRSMRDAVDQLNANDREMPRAERTADESLRVACLTFLGVALARLAEARNGIIVQDVEEAIRVVIRSARDGSVNVRVHACKSLARILKNGTAGYQCDIADFLSSMLVPNAPVRVMMASARALLGMSELSILKGGQVMLVERCVTCSRAPEGISDSRTRALRQALRRLLGELVVRVMEEGGEWSGGSVAIGDLYDCVAIYYRLPGFLKHRFEDGDDNVLAEFPEESRFAIGSLLEMRQ